MVNAAEAYKRQQVLTATPEALTLMLYNGALRFMTEGREAIEKRKRTTPCRKRRTSLRNFA